MKVYQLADGGTNFSTREYDIAADAQVECGAVMRIVEGRAAAASQYQTTPVIGIAAESHSGEEDVFDPRANGTKIRIWDSPNLIFQCAAPRVTATSGGSSTLLAINGGDLGAFADDDFIGGYIRLAEKAQGSTNTDRVGDIRRITDSSGTQKTWTLEEGGTPCVGDVYEVYPPIGFMKGCLTDDRCGLRLVGTTNLALRVIGRDFDKGLINMMPAKHILANYFQNT